MNVFVLSCARPLSDGQWAGMFIGVYSSVEKVELAKERLRLRPGYRAFPTAFEWIVIALMRITMIRCSSRTGDQSSLRRDRPIFVM
jgi:hypothetical protein